MRLIHLQLMLQVPSITGSNVKFQSGPIWLGMTELNKQFSVVSADNWRNC